MSNSPSFLPEPTALVNTWRRFGAYGPAYRIDAIVKSLSNGDTLFRVSVPNPLGEDVTERLFSEILTDPEEG